MKKYLSLLFISVFVTFLIHLGLWVYNNSLHQERMSHQSRMRKLLSKSEFTNVEDIRKLRIELDEYKKKNLTQYKWINKDKGYVEIPIDKAMDYYLRSLNKPSH